MKVWLQRIAVLQTLNCDSALRSSMREGGVLKLSHFYMFSRQRGGESKSSFLTAHQHKIGYLVPLQVRKA